MGHLKPIGTIRTSAWGPNTRKSRKRIIATILHPRTLSTRPSIREPPRTRKHLPQERLLEYESSVHWSGRRTSPEVHKQDPAVDSMAREHNPTIPAIDDHKFPSASAKSDEVRQWINQWFRTRKVPEPTWKKDTPLAWTGQDLLTLRECQLETGLIGWGICELYYALIIKSILDERKVRTLFYAIVLPTLLKTALSWSLGRPDNIKQE